MVSFVNRLFVWIAACVLSAHAFVPATTRGTTSTRLFMAAPDGVQKGTVKWFNTVKGFGFITPDDGSDDCFVHQTAIQMEGFRSLADGEPVEYQVEIDANGRTKATSVTGPEGKDPQGAPFEPNNDFDNYY